jgi:hypothetical protein
MPRNALGRGLGALIREPEVPTTPVSPSTAPVVTSGGSAAAPAPALVPPASPPGRSVAGPQEIDIDLIDPSPYQPRTRFRE